MKKTILTYFIILCLLSTVFMMGLAFNVQPVKASGTIYIRADGSVDPPTAPIHRDGDLYTLTGNITSDIDGIVIDRDNMILNGAGYTLRGSDVTYSRGIDLSERSDVTIKNANIRSFYNGVCLISASSCTVSGNNITASRGVAIGFWDGSSYNDISGNNIANNDQGIWLVGSYNDISGNNITASRMTGISLFLSDNDISGNNIENNSQCIYIGGSYNNVFGNNIIANNHTGMRLQGASNNNVSGNNITDSSDMGIYLDDSRSNSIFGNTIADIGNDGILCLAASSSNSIFGNYIAENGWGIRLSFSSEDNLVYHNSFVNNTIQAFHISGTPVNIWDDGYPSGENYWSDYEEKYPDAEQIDEAGMWNAPYVIDENNQDNYPLINPWSPPQVEDVVPFWMQWWFWAIIAVVVVVLAVGTVSFLKRRKPTPTASMPLAETPTNRD